MICDSRVRRVSRNATTRFWWGAVLVIAALAGLGGGSVHAQASRPWPPRLEPVEGAALDPALRNWFDDDRTWMALQPAALLAEPAAADSTALVAWLRRAESTRATVAPDTAGTDPAQIPVRGHRSLLSGLRDRWLDRGYLGVTVTLKDPGGAEQAALVIVDPGQRHTIAELAVEGEAFNGRDRLLEAWLPRAGDPFRPSAYLDAAAGVVAGCAERGHPFPLWLTREVTIDSAAASVTITAVLVPGPVAVVGPQTTNLLDGRGESFLIRTAGLKPGRPFRESDLRRGMDRLLVRDLYERVDEPLVHLTTARDTVGVVWRVEPLQRANRVNVVLGLSQEPEGGTRLSGQVDLSFPNLAGTGRSLDASWSDDGDDRARFGFAYLEPLIFGTPLDTDIALDNEVRKDQYTRFTLENRWRLPVVSLWGVEIGVGWDRTTYPTGQTERTKRLRGRAAVLHARGDRSRSGWSGIFAIETANRSTTFRTVEDGEVSGGSELGTQDSQRLYEGDLGGELWVRPTVSLAGRAAFRQNDADVRPVPLSEQYYYGGARTLRGYRENEFHGETVAYGGVELRLGRARRSRVYTFVDVGYFEFSAYQGGDTDAPLVKRKGNQIGFGLGLMTAAASGQLDLAVGFPGTVDFESAKLHVALLGSF